MIIKDIKTYAEIASRTIVIRTVDGTGFKRQADEREKVILYNLIHGALQTINYSELDIETVAITAEHIGSHFIENMNGYDSVYLKIINYPTIIER